MIPKIIHYCWFGGGDLPELALKCIESWKTYCPDYVIKEWNETNFDLHFNDYVYEAYQEKKWAFVSDVVRLYALVSEGGIYMDTDVEVIKPLDNLLKQQAFFGFEKHHGVGTAIMGCEKSNGLFKELLDSYLGKKFINPDGSLDYTSNVSIITDFFEKKGLTINNLKQSVLGCFFYPYDFFSPIDCLTKNVAITSNTYSIHYFNGSWLPIERKKAMEYVSKLSKIMPMKVAIYISFFWSYAKYKGLGFALSKVCNHLKKNLQ